MNFATLKTVVLSGTIMLGLTAMNPQAKAQSQAELLELIRQQARQIEALSSRLGQLEAQSQTAVTTANRASAAAEAASAKADKAEETAQKGAEPTTKWGPSPTFKSADGRFEMHVRGRLMADFGYVNDNIGEQDRFATEFRRARLGIEGVAWQDVKYRFELDFADNDVNITDAYLQYAGFKSVKIMAGQFKERVSLDEQSSSRHIAVMERAAFTDAFGFQRRIGIGLDFGAGDFALKTGLYGGGDLTSNDDNEGFAVAARALYTPAIGNGGRLLIGASVRHRDLNNDQDGGDVRYRQRPVAHVSGIRYVSTGSLDYIDSDTWYGVELAATTGPFFASAEYGMMKSSVASGMEDEYLGESSLNFSGGYFDVGWFLTGENRPLKSGAWDRPNVNKPVFQGGTGAWALVGRYDYLDLNDTDAGVIGGKQQSFIFGVNWYLNRHVRVMLNYAHTKVKDGCCGLHGDAVVGEDGKAKIDTVTGRFQVDW